MTSVPALILIAPIRFYQRFITPYTPATCRYYPTCSAYAVTALRTRGALVGTGLTIWRLLRCNPWSSGGVDHVPARGERRRLRDEHAHVGHDRRDRERRAGSGSSSSGSLEPEPNGTDHPAGTSPAQGGQSMVRRSAA